MCVWCRYAKDNELFRKDFAAAFKKLTELGFTEFGLAWYETTAGMVGLTAAAAAGLYAASKQVPVKEK